VANHSSAEKRNRQRIARTVRNRAIKSQFRTLIKRVREAVAKGDRRAASAALRGATTALDSAVTKGVLHRATASRSISRLTVAVNRLGSAAN
jgi:small subunit ribosomal protein S20